MIGSYALERLDNFVAYKDVGEERELGAASFEDLTNSLLFAVIFIFLSSGYQRKQNY